MSSLLLEQLDPDSLLLLYISGELSGDDAAEVERRVAADAAMSAQVQRLRQAHGFLETVLSADDEQTRLPMSTDTAVRRVCRAMKQWQIDRLTKKSMPGARPHFRLPVWSYPVAVAVAVIIAVLVWARALPDAGENRLSPEQITELQRKATEEFLTDFETSYYQEVESQNLLATREMPTGPEDFVDDVFLRTGG